LIYIMIGVIVILFSLPEKNVNIIKTIIRNKMDTKKYLKLMISILYRFVFFLFIAKFKKILCKFIPNKVFYKNYFDISIYRLKMAFLKVFFSNIRLDLYQICNITTARLYEMLKLHYQRCVLDFAKNLSFFT